MESWIDWQTIRDVWGRRFGPLPREIFGPIVDDKPTDERPDLHFPNSADDETADRSTPQAALPTVTYRFLTWNAGPENTDSNVFNKLNDGLHDHNIHWATLSEITKHLDAVRRIPDYNVMGARDSVAIVYRKDLLAVNPFTKQMTRTWRGPRTGRQHPPRSFPRLTLSLPGRQPVRVTALHLTAYCKWRSGVLVSRVPGAANAFREQAEWLVRNSQRFPDRREFLSGDLNARWNSRGKWSLNWIENQGGFTGHADTGRVDSAFFKHGEARIRSLGVKWGSDTHNVYVGTFRPKPFRET